MEYLLDMIKQLVAPFLEGINIDLVELKMQRQNRQMFLRFLVDKPSGGISLEECAKLNEEIGQLLDNQDFIQESFVLEVSSPGLDRPLMTLKDFGRAIGKDVRIFLKETIQGKIEIAGTVTSVKGDSVVINADQEELEIPLEKINKAKYIF